MWSGRFALMVMLCAAPASAGPDATATIRAHVNGSGMMRGISPWAKGLVCRNPPHPIKNPCTIGVAAGKKTMFEAVPAAGWRVKRWSQLTCGAKPICIVAFPAGESHLIVAFEPLPPEIH